MTRINRISEEPDASVWAGLSDPGYSYSYSYSYSHSHSYSEERNGSGENIER